MFTLEGNTCELKKLPKTNLRTIVITEHEQLNIIFYVMH